LLLPSEQIVGRTLREILPPHVAEPAMDAVELAVAGGTASFEYALEVAGEGRHYEARVVPCGNDVLAVVRDITELQRNRDELAATAERLRVTLLDTVRAMGAMVQLRDPYTAGHERRVAALAEAVAGVLGLDEDRRRTVLVAGEIHDIGKIGVPAETLSKPRRLSPDERRLVEEHPERGYEILAGIHFDAPVAEIVRQHHERLDGSGYPRGLRGDEILPEARILAAADVLEAMSSHRPYRPALGVDAGLAELRAGAGVLFDERVVAACEEAVARGLVDLSESSAASWSLQM
jgi:putative nucleotidyltransferase with HDIG domain